MLIATTLALLAHDDDDDDDEFSPNVCLVSHVEGFGGIFYYQHLFGDYVRRDVCVCSRVYVEQKVYVRQRNQHGVVEHRRDEEEEKGLN